MTAEDLALFVLRCCVGATLLAHGWHHVFGGGRLPGTGRWFESIGLRPGLLHAFLASFVELGAGSLLLLGLLTPLACAGVAGTMTTALVANHWKNGFFIFRPGEGYEYVLNLIVAAMALSALGPGGVSLDHVAGLHWARWPGLAVAATAGVGGALVLLALCWRPARSSARE